MSSDLSDRQWRFYVDDMLGFCDRVLRFNAGVSREKFAADPMRYDATVRNIELIGEAATHIPLVVKKGWAFFLRLLQAAGWTDLQRKLRGIFTFNPSNSGSMNWVVG